jgi:hypothetical protein
LTLQPATAPPQNPVATRTWLRWDVRPALLLVLAALLGGCSGGAPAARSTPTPTPTPTSTPSLPALEPVDPLSPQPPVESPAPTAQGRPTCAGATLAVQDADLLADSRQLQEVFAVRTSGPTCQLRGWPEVTLLGGNDAPLTVAFRRTGSAVAGSLSRSSSLSFVLSTPRSTTCADVSAVLVRLPGTDRVIRTGTTMQVCDGSLEISPVERRQDDEG